jgi:methionyl aminopeptidase
MSIKSNREFEGMRSIGRIVRTALDRMAAKAQPGITTAELSEIGARSLAEFGAESSPPKVYGFPGAVCISVNDEAIHGIPGDRVLENGDLLKLDLTADKDGFVADAALTVRVGKVSALAEALASCAENAFHVGAKAARAGSRVYEIGRAVDRHVQAAGFCVMRELAGHGVGRTIHEAPSVPNYFDKRARAHLIEGLVITIEPIIAAGSGQQRLMPDGWTIKTADRSLSAHYEHTLVIAKSRPILLTAANRT